MNLQNFCKSVSFLSKSRKITFYEHQVNVVCDFKSFSQLKEKRIRRGGHKKVHSLLKEKREFWETSSRFTLQSLGLSLDMLIYIIRYSKPEADDCRFNL